MGDEGSATLGFLFAAVPFHTAGAAPSALVFVVALALWMFLADGVYTLVRRATRGERFWEAHRSHLYQRLTQAGYRHDQVVMIALALAVPVAGGGWASWAIGGSWGWVSLALALVVFAIFVGIVRRCERASAVRSASSAATKPPTGEEAKG